MILKHVVLDAGLVLGQAAAVMVARRMEYERPGDAALAATVPPGPHEGPGETAGGRHRSSSG
ncbi:hypothetical protein ACFU99_26730 [Streptomyces sp. NPDC057654]|uniref:hypothetical protein n=1 Tax=Streptomyces sp. NPDC057654 TaxID=3346196 RepID=UPI0036CDD656